MLKASCLWPESVAVPHTAPIAALTVQIYTYALTPYDDWHRQAWAGAMVLVGLILILSVLARWATQSRYHLGG